ncbi:MAG: HAMP domain-containing sensor histidine kinase [Pseudomonadota bacterium]|nr:MAG: sensor histidine kinase [Pseudomonadota bacterium]
MRLATSLGIWLAGLTGIILGVHGWAQLSAERTDLTSAARRELVLLATAVRGAVENAVRDGQEPDAAALLEQLELRDPAVDIFVFDSAGSVLGSSRGSEPNLDLARSVARASAGTDALQSEHLPSGDFVATAPLRAAGGGRLVILRPSNALLADLQAELRATVVSIGVVIAALWTGIWVVVRLRVHHPMRRFITEMRRIRGGDLSGRLALPGRDEFAELAREFDAMAEALERTRQQLTQEADARSRLEQDMERANRMATVGELAATLAHEIGSPLQVLNGRARDLEARSDLPNDARRSASILVEQTDRVHHIVERLLDVARRKTPELRPVDVRETVQTVVELLSCQARRAGVTLVVDVHAVPVLECDPAQLQQVLLNLLQNALRASPRGGTVRLTVESSSFPRAPDSRPQPSVAIVVDDDGMGIPETIRGRIFEPFFSAWGGERPARGTGLGLSVVRSIVVEHGGTVSAGENPAGRGARLVVHLPVPTPARALAGVA